MCLTEPQAGTDLGLVRMKAVPVDPAAGIDGAYRLTGSKIFISGGDHDLTENIVHLVLARLPDAPSGHQGDQPLRHSEAARGGRQARAERRHLRRHRAQDGDQGLADLRHQLRRRRGLPGRRAEQGHEGDVHLHERRAAARRRPGPGARRGVLSGGGEVRPRTAAGARPHRREVSRPGGRSDPRPSGRAADAAHHARLHRRGAGAHRLGGDRDRPRRERPGSGARRGRRRPGLAAHAGDQGVPDRSRLRDDQPRRAGLRRLRLLRRLRRRAAGARLPHHPDLRGDERHPGARPRRPQAPGAHGALPAPLLPSGAGVPRPPRRTTPR